MKIGTSPDSLRFSTGDNVIFNMNGTGMLGVVVDLLCRADGMPEGYCAAYVVRLMDGRIVMPPIDHPDCLMPAPVREPVREPGPTAFAAAQLRSSWRSNFGCVTPAKHSHVRAKTCSAADLEMLADLLVLGKDAFDILVRCSSGCEGIYCDDALHLYARLGSDAALGLDAWQEILDEVDGIDLLDGGNVNNIPNGILTRQEWMSWITRLCDTSCTPYEISEMHEELAGIVDDLTRAALLKTHAVQRDAKGRVDERDADGAVACCAAGAPSSCAAQ